MSEGGKALLYLYRRLLRSAATYPSKNRWGIYQAIREEFKENRNMDPDDKKTHTKIDIAYKGLPQLRQFDEIVMQGGDSSNPNWSVTLEQDPMPKPPPKK